MLLLAFDTSTRQSSIALCSDDTVFYEYTWNTGGNHSVELLENMQRLLAACGRSFQELDGIAVATGPGSFNGARVAVATAKALAFSLQKPLIGVGTLDLLAFQQQQWRGVICAVLEAGRTELYSACFRAAWVQDKQGNLIPQLERISDYFLLPVDELGQRVQELLAENEVLAPALFCGEIKSATRQRLYAQLQAKAVFLPALRTTRHASALAALALPRLLAGKIEDPLTLEPFYMRRPSITKSTRKRPLLGGLEVAESEQQQRDTQQTEREEGALRH
uniref:tRNA (Adenosine(37)-N6)-threonylcarbamoyltransferase complex dimerization subunit type 1 TsaB n=1 Tax=Thermosporothrix sp. COM3 TaxID=2490863 RepID=A0A455STH7_9CHLR|nr:tRNA (adenosine(37)-N6)-threonylcarbamoyltransferase complex dimerization subunit type 1 TsaB [Thermosporothrix sp. COM3]